MNSIKPIDTGAAEVLNRSSSSRPEASGFGDLLAQISGNAPDSVRGGEATAAAPPAEPQSVTELPPSDGTVLKIALPALDASVEEPGTAKAKPSKESSDGRLDTVMLFALLQRPAGPEIGAGIASAAPKPLKLQTAGVPRPQGMPAEVQAEVTIKVEKTFEMPAANIAQAVPARQAEVEPEAGAKGEKSLQMPMPAETPEKKSIEPLATEFRRTEPAAAVAEPEGAGSQTPAAQELPAERVLGERVPIAPGSAHRESAEQHEKHGDSSGQNAETPQPAVPASMMARFDPHVSGSAPAQPVARVQDALPQQPVPVAHRVSIDVGEGDSRVTVTLHERGGDVSVKVHTATDAMRSELQSSVGNLVEAFRREHVSLANTDFTSNYNQPSDPGQQRREQQHQPQPRRNPAFAEAAAEEDAGITDSIDIRG